ELAEQVPHSAYADSPDWALAWWSTYGANRSVRLATWRGEGGRLDAVVGLVDVRERVHARVPLTVGVTVNLRSRQASADHVGVLCRPERVEEVRAWLSRQAGRNGLLLRDLDPDSGVPVVPSGARLVQRKPCPRLSLDDWREQAIPTPHFRKRISYYRRRLT